jgi:hypothetical protein
MSDLARHLRSLPLPTRFAAVGAACAGVAGAIAGLVIGLNVYAPTAWFALFELGVPASVVGGATGLLAGALTIAGKSAAGRVERRDASSR